jgi:hypothetical protein
MPSSLVNYFPEVFDSSMVATLKQCPQLFKKIYVDQWKAKELNVHLIAGGAFARGLEVTRNAFYVDGHSAEDSIAMGARALLTHYGDFQCPPDSGKSAIRTAGALEFYFSNYPLSHNTAYPITLPGGKRAIEFSFAHPLSIDHPVTGHPILYCGRLDAILQYAGDTFVFDEKTTSYLGSTWGRKWDLRSQFTGYCWGCRQYGIRAAGVVVRGVSILKTKYETIEAISYRPDWMVDRWYGELLEWIAEAIGWWRTGRYKYNLDESCTSYGGCGFATVCQSQDERPWLESYFERRHWDPVTRTETILEVDDEQPADPTRTALAPSRRECIT